MVYHWTSERRDQYLHVCSHEEAPHSYEFLPQSSLSWTNVGPSDTSQLLMSYPLVLSASLLPFFGHVLIFLYSSYIIHPRTAQYLQWGCTSDEYSGTITSFNWLTTVLNASQDLVPKSLNVLLACKFQKVILVQPSWPLPLSLALCHVGIVCSCTIKIWL